MLVQETKSPNKAVVALIVVTLLATVAAGSLYAYNSQNEASPLAQSTNSAANSTIAGNSQTTSTASPASSYVNGTYTATGNYSTPESTESIDLTVTLVDSTITNVSIQNSGNVRESRDYQQRFMHNCTNLVVGKNINSVSLNRVAGSSLTSNGFNSALDQIKADAAA